MTMSMTLNPSTALHTPPDTRVSPVDSIIAEINRLSARISELFAALAGAVASQYRILREKSADFVAGVH